jgi:hypothetical protein
VHLISVYPQHSYASAFLPSVTVAVGKVFILSLAIDCQMRTSQRYQTLIHSEHVVPRLEAVVPLLVELFGVCNTQSVQLFFLVLLGRRRLPCPVISRTLLFPGRTETDTHHRARNCPYPGLLPNLSATPLPFYRYPPTHTDPHRHPLYRLCPWYHSPFKWKYIWKDYSGGACQLIRGDAGCRLEFVP